VKNTDDKCLYAALFLAFVYNKTEVEINNKIYKFDEKSYVRHFCNYEEKGKKNLYFYTHLIFNLINPLNESLPA